MARKILAVTMMVSVDTEVYADTYGIRESEVDADVPSYVDAFVKGWMGHHLAHVNNGIELGEVTVQ